MLELKPLVLRDGEFIMWDDSETLVFDSVRTCVLYIRANWHPRMKQLRLWRTDNGGVLVYSMERRLLSWVNAYVTRFWRSE